MLLIYICPQESQRRNSDSSIMLLLSVIVAYLSIETSEVNDDLIEVIHVVFCCSRIDCSASTAGLRSRRPLCQLLISSLALHVYNKEIHNNKKNKNKNKKTNTINNNHAPRLPHPRRHRRPQSINPPLPHRNPHLSTHPPTLPPTLLLFHRKSFATRLGRLHSSQRLKDTFPSFYIPFSCRM